MITVIDYGIGNLGSVVKAFQFLDIPVKLTSSKQEIRKAEAVVLPGVGAFGEGMNNLNKLGLKKVIKEVAANEVPLLGICLGLQLFFASSEENPEIKGLDLLPGKVKKFKKEDVNKIPHMGWNQVELKKEDPLFKCFSRPRNFYFVHSYYVKPETEKVILGKTTYGKKEFTSVIRNNNIWGIQCHPEKSSKIGLKVLKNFYALIRGDR